MRWIIRWTPLKRWGFFWFQHVWSRLICETCVTRIMAWELAFHSHYLKHPEPETNEHLSHPELLSLWCFHCRHCFVLSANSTVVAVVGEEDQDFLTRQIRILYGSCNGRAVTGSLCSPRSLSFSFALNVVEVVSNQLSCKSHSDWAVQRRKPRSAGCVIPSRAVGYRICSVSDTPTWWAISDHLSELLREASGLCSHTILKTWPRPCSIIILSVDYVVLI